MGPFDNETFLHFFILCPTVAAIHHKVEVDLLELEPDPDRKRWFGLESNNNFFLRLFILTL
jgi:hypothetical protein